MDRGENLKHSKIQQKNNNNKHPSFSFQLWTEILDTCEDRCFTWLCIQMKKQSRQEFVLFVFSPSSLNYLEFLSSSLFSHHWALLWLCIKTTLMLISLGRAKPLCQICKIGHWFKLINLSQMRDQWVRETRRSIFNLPSPLPLLLKAEYV